MAVFSGKGVPYTFIASLAGVRKRFDREQKVKALSGLCKEPDLVGDRCCRDRDDVGGGRWDGIIQGIGFLRGHLLFSLIADQSFNVINITFVVAVLRSFSREFEAICVFREA